MENTTLVEITKMEAATLFSYYQTRMLEFRDKGLISLANVYADHANKWFKIVTEL